MRDRKAYQAEWYRWNRERLLAKAKHYRAEHLDAIRRKDREYARTHSCQAVKRVTEWRKRNPEKVTAQRRAARQRLPDSIIRARLHMPTAPAELIAAKRELILAKRAMKELSHETR